MSKGLIDRAQQKMHERMTGKPREILVPGFAEDGGDLVVHVWPITSEEYNAIQRFKSDLDRAAENIAQRARDANKNLLYKNEREEIVRFFGPPMVMALSARIDADIIEEVISSGIKDVGK